MKKYMVIYDSAIINNIEKGLIRLMFIIREKNKEEALKTAQELAGLTSLIAAKLVNIIEL